MQYFNAMPINTLIYTYHIIILLMYPNVHRENEGIRMIRFPVVSMLGLTVRKCAVQKMGDIRPPVLILRLWPHYKKPMHFPFTPISLGRRVSQLRANVFYELAGSKFSPAYLYRTVVGRCLIHFVSGWSKNVQ